MLFRSVVLIAAFASSVFGQQTACPLDGSYTVALAAVPGVVIGSGAFDGSSMSLDFGAVGGGSASGTFSTANGVGTATLTGTGTYGAAAQLASPSSGAYTWNADCSAVTITIISQRALLTKVVSEPGPDPCFPSSATVTLADGTPSRIDALKEGDVILAATQNGALTTDTVSFLSIAKPEAEATFITLTTSKKSLTLTPEHHLPFGATCCAELKKAKDVTIGDVVWTLDAGAVAPHAVVKIGLEIKMGLHSPVLSGGSFPVVDGLVTSFDSIEGVTLARLGLNYLGSLCKATGTCGLVRAAFISAEHKYIGESAVLATSHAAFELVK